MALVKCKECGNQVYSKVKNCPACGAKVVKSVGLLGWIFVIVVVIPVTWSFVTSSGNVDSQKAVVSAVPKKEAPKVPVPAKPKENWRSAEYKDAMTDKITKVASTDSLNTTAFEFPYNQVGGSRLTLAFRHKDGEIDSYLKVDKGHMLCSYSNCNFTLRVDSGKVQTWTGLQSSTYDSDMMFVRDARSLEKIVKSGKPLKIGIEFYKAGTRVFEFEPSGYPSVK